jgi:alpha-1,2-glucosyltransferase
MSLSRRAAWAFLLAGLAAGAAIAWRIPQQLVDEMHYGPQICGYMAGRLDFDPLITMVPTYHVIVAAIGKLFGECSDRLARGISLAGSLVLLPFAWRLARAEGADPSVRVPQSLFSPLLFTYLFLIYTDGWSLAAFAALLHFTMRGRLGIAAAIGAFGIALRQDFVIWVVMAWVMATWADGPWARLEAARVKQLLARTFPFLLVLAAFGAFVWWNGGIAVGDRSRHAGAVNMTNVYLMLVYGWILFLPFNLAVAPRVMAMAKRPAVALSMAVAFAGYWLTYSNPHEYNQENLRYFVHNEALYWMTAHPVVRAALFIPGAWMALTAVHAANERPALRVPLLFSVAAAALHPLVEPRYVLPAFLLFNLWRPAMSPLAENTMLALYICGAFFVLHGVQALWFFP